MISYLAEATRRTIQCNTNSRPPSPLALNLYPDGIGYVPSLETFIGQLVSTCDVDKRTLLSTLVYLRRVSTRLPAGTMGFRCTAHRMFLAALILADKYINDKSSMNKDWATSSLVYLEGELIFGFSLTEVNLLEKQLLHLLDWDLAITESDWMKELASFKESGNEEQI